MHVIPREERLKLDANCDLLLSDALVALEDFNGTADPTHWRALARSEQLTFYRAVAPSTPVMATSPQAEDHHHHLHHHNHNQQTGGAMLRFLVTGYLNGSLTQVTNGLYSDASHDLMVQQSVLYAAGCENSNSNTPPSSTSGSRSSSAERRHSIRSTFSNGSGGAQALPQQQQSSSLIDASVLHASEQEHRRAPFRFAGVKWYAWHSKDGSDRDLLAYERSGATTDNEDEEIMYHVVQSIERPQHSSPETRLPPGMRHTKLSVCFLYREVCDDLVECFAVGEYPARGSAMSQRAEDEAVSERVLTASRALAAYSAKKLSRLIEKNRKLPVIMSKSCLRCSARRTVFDPLRTCSICKKSVCQNCRQDKTIFKLNIDTNKPETEVFCNKCLSRSKLPNTQPVSIDRIKQQTQIRKNSRERMSSRSSSNNNDRHRFSVGSAGSGGSGGSGGRSSIMSGGSGGRASVMSSVSSAPSSVVSVSSPSRSLPAPRTNALDGFNYDALIHHYAAEKPKLVRSRTRTRASTLSSPIDTDNHDCKSIIHSNKTHIGSSTPKEAEKPLTAIAMDVLEGEEVVLENLRDTQIGLPVILVDVKPLRDTQLGVPVEIETGRVSEPMLSTTSRATFFGAISAPSPRSPSGGSSNVTTLSPRCSPRRSDLYLADRHDANGNGTGVEKLYQTYLERRDKLQTEAAGEQEVRNIRLAVSREHQQQEHRRRSTTEDNQSSSSPSARATQSFNYPHMSGSRHSDLSRGRRSEPSPHRKHNPESPPKKQDFRMDLYAQF